MAPCLQGYGLADDLAAFLRSVPQKFVRYIEAETLNFAPMKPRTRIYGRFSVYGQLASLAQRSFCGWAEINVNTSHAKTGKLARYICWLPQCSS